MKKRVVFIALVVLTSLAFVNCEDKTASNEETSTTSLLKKDVWEHSYEESLNTYRPLSYNLPISRYRQSFHFEDNNVCTYSVLAPDDGHYSKEGRWEFNEENKNLTIFDENSKILYDFKIVELTENILKVENITSSTKEK